MFNLSKELQESFDTPIKLYNYTKQLIKQLAIDIKTIEDKYNSYYYKINNILPIINVKNNFTIDIFKIINKYNTRITELRHFYVVPCGKKRKNNLTKDECECAEYVIDCDKNFQYSINLINHTYQATTFELTLGSLLLILPIGYHYLNPKFNYLKELTFDYNKLKNNKK